MAKDDPIGGLGSILSRAGEAIEDVLHPVPTVHVDPTARFQIVEGWGTSLAWWAAVIGGWPDPVRSQIADLVFDRSKGLGLNAVRYNIGGGDDPAHHHLRAGGAVPGYQSAPGRWEWEADANQRWVLAAARERGANLFEAFSNSPPYWMTVSGCAAGSRDGTSDNLNVDSIDAFASYLAEVVAHFRDEWDIVFQTVEPFNEPLGTNWKAGNNQEGCHISRDQQRAVLASLAAALEQRGVTGTAIVAADDYSIDQAADLFDAYDSADLARVGRVNTHSYSGTRRADLRERVAAAGKPLWMSEFGLGADGDLGAALQLSAQVRRDMTELRPSAWVYWQAVENAGNNWGLIKADFDHPDAGYRVIKPYYAMAHYTRFIRPGYRIIGVDGVNALAAYDEQSGTLVIVHDNAEAAGTHVRFDLSRCRQLPASASVCRTSETEDLAQLTPEPVENGALTVLAGARSITTYVLTGVTV